MQQVKFGITLIRYRVSLVDKPLERKNYVIEGNVVSEATEGGFVTVEVTGGCEIATGCLISLINLQMKKFSKLVQWIMKPLKRRKPRW